MSVIQIHYNLSEAGQKDALTKGVNIGRDPVIRLMSPDHPEPAPAEETDQAAAAMDAARAKVTDPKMLATMLIAAVQQLTKALDPRLASVHTERADKALWTAAAALAGVNDEGDATILVGFDTNRRQSITGFEYKRTRSDQQPVIVEPVLHFGYEKFDSLQTAAELIAFEKRRRMGLTAQRMELEEGLAVKTAEILAQERQATLDQAIQMAVYTLQECKGFEDLPEVRELKRIVDIQSEDIFIQDLHRNKPEEKARKAVEAAKKACAEQEITEWVQAHGSEHLRMLLSEGLLLPTGRTLYQNERLALERPGWDWGHNIHTGQPNEMAPSMKDLVRLKAARATVRDAQLGYIIKHDYAFQTIIFARFLGRNIVLPENSSQD